MADQETDEKPQKQVWIKFLLLCGLLIGYFAYLSYEFDILTGGMAALLSWSFFVLCTPIADAGFLLDFPLRLLFGIRMVISEMAVWAIAISVNFTCLFWFRGYYETTGLTRLFRQILLHPYPYWGVVLLSAAGTFLSVKFGDELMDVIRHRDRHYFHRHGYKYELIFAVVAFALVFIAYYELAASLNIRDAIQK